MTRFTLFISQAFGEKPLKEDEGSAESSSRTKELENRQDQSSNPILTAIEKLKQDLTKKIEDEDKTVKRLILGMKYDYGKCRSVEKWNHFPCRMFMNSKEDSSLVPLRYGCYSVGARQVCWRQRAVGSSEPCSGKVEGVIQYCDDRDLEGNRGLYNTCDRPDLLCE